MQPAMASIISVVLFASLLCGAALAKLDVAENQAIINANCKNATILSAVNMTTNECLIRTRMAMDVLSKGMSVSVSAVYPPKVALVSFPSHTVINIAVPPWRSSCVHNPHGLLFSVICARQECVSPPPH